MSKGLLYCVFTVNQHLNWTRRQYSHFWGTQGWPGVERGTLGCWISTSSSSNFSWWAVVWFAGEFAQRRLLPSVVRPKFYADEMITLCTGVRHTQIKQYQRPFVFTCQNLVWKADGKNFGHDSSPLLVNFFKWYQIRERRKRISKY